MKNKTLVFTRPSVVCTLALISCLLWGSAFPCVKIGYSLFKISPSDTGSQLVFAGMRFTLAGIMAILTASVIRKQFVHPKKETVKYVIKLGCVQTFLQYLLFYIGLAHTTGIKSSILDASNVFVAILISSLIFKYEKLSAKKLLGCAAGFAGVILINLGDGGISGGFSLNGEGAIFMSTVAYALSSVLVKKYSDYEDTLVLSGYQFLFGGILLTFIGLIFGGAFPDFSFSSVLLLIYMGFISACAYSLWGILLKYNTVGKVTIYSFSTPVFGVFLSALILNENKAFGLTTLISLALVCVGIILVNRSKD